MGFYQFSKGSSVDGEVLFISCFKTSPSMTYVMLDILAYSHLHGPPGIYL